MVAYRKIDHKGIVMRELLRDGVKYSADQVRQLRQEWLQNYREWNRSEEVEKILGSDRAYERYRDEIDEFLRQTGYDVTDENVFGENVSENIALAKELREKGKSPWKNHLEKDHSEYSGGLNE